jgi:nitrogen-specific signal transduction histidine kinase
MNTVSTDFRFFIEYDSNPFILFSDAGKILYLNNVAEILLGYVSQQELYDITLSYAPKHFGHKNTRLELQYDVFSFYAIQVAYENEEQIGLRLYHKPRPENSTYKKMGEFPPTDINALLEASITLFKLENDNHLELLVDQDLPPIRIDQNRFSKLLRKVLHTFRASDAIHISLKLMVGEYVLIEGRRERIIQLSIEANGRYTDLDTEIREIAEDISVTCILKEKSLRLQLPFIQILSSDSSSIV